MDASDAHCRPCPRSRLSWCCALFGCSSRERARGGNSSERVWELRGRCVELLLACLLFPKCRAPHLRSSPDLSRKKRAVQVKSVSCSFCVLVFVCLFVSALSA